MSKKKAITGAIIVMIVWFAIWGIALKYLSKTNEAASIKNFVLYATDFISENATFQEEFGNPIEMTVTSESIMVNENATTEYYMDFVCSTDTGEHNIRVFRYQNQETQEWLMRYEALPTP